MNSLKLKFLGLTGIILVAAIIGTTWYNLNTQRRILHKMTAEHARMVELVEQALDAIRVLGGVLEEQDAALDRR